MREAKAMITFPQYSVFNYGIGSAFNLATTSDFVEALAAYSCACNEGECTDIPTLVKLFDRAHITPTNLTGLRFEGEFNCQ